MTARKCFSLIRSLNNSEWDCLHRYLKAQKTPISLIRLAATYRTKSEKEDSTPKKSVDRKNDTLLVKRVETWIKQQYIAKDDVYGLLQLIRHCYNHNNHLECLAYIKQFKQFVTEAPASVRIVALQNEVVEIELNLHEKENNWDEAAASIMKLNHFQQLHYLLNITSNTCKLLNFSMIGTDVSFQEQIDFVAKQIELQKHYISYKLLYLYVLLFNTMKDRSNKEAYSLYQEQLFKTNKREIDADELSLFLSLHRNYIISKINSGDHSYEADLFEYWKFSLANDLIFENNNITFGGYINAISIAIRNNEIKWAYQFLEQHRKKLLPEDENNAYHFSKAICKFHEQKYDEALQLLNSVHFNHQVYKIYTRQLLLKVFYKLGDYQLLNAQSNSFKLFLFRSKEVTQAHRNNFNNFNKYIMKLANTPRFDKKKNHKIREEILSEKHLADRRWLVAEISDRLVN